MRSAGRLCCGCIYHIYNRGNGKESLFKEEWNYYHFIDLYKKYLHSIAHLYAYCLLPTDCHLVVRIKEWAQIENCIHNQDQIWFTFKAFLGTYTKTINKTYNRTGHLFQISSPKRLANTDPNYLNLIASIHRNPEHQGIVQDFRNWPFSSYDAYQKQDRRSLIAKEILLDPKIYNTIMEMHASDAVEQVSVSIKAGNGLL